MERESGRQCERARCRHLDKTAARHCLLKLNALLAWTNSDRLFNQTGELDITAIGNHLSQSNKCRPSVSLPLQANTAHLNSTMNTLGFRKADQDPDPFQHLGKPAPAYLHSSTTTSQQRTTYIYRQARGVVAFH